MNKKGKKIRHRMAGILISAIFAGVYDRRSACCAGKRKV